MHAASSFASRSSEQGDPVNCQKHFHKPGNFVEQKRHFCQYLLEPVLIDIRVVDYIYKFYVYVYMFIISLHGPVG